MQARAMVDKEKRSSGMCAWLLIVLTSIITYSVLESVRYNLMFSLPSLDSSITHTRGTSDKRQLTYTFARFILS